MSNGILAAFPGLRVDGYRVTSSATPGYNCIAWAAGRSDRWWWPNSADAFWPAEAPNVQTVGAFEAAFRLLRYQPCGSEAYEWRYEKVAIFALPDGTPTHAARQLPNGRWTSKLGRLEDIEHAIAEAVAGQTYGAAVLYMRRRRSVWGLVMVLAQWIATRLK